MKNTRVLLVCLLVLSACNKSEETHSLNVGDSVFDPKMDDPAYEVCNEDTIKQYYVRWSRNNPAGYVGEKRAIIDHYFSGYKRGDNRQSGYLTIRFIVNCKGKVGRLRTQEMDFEYREMKFDDAIKSQLIALTKQLDAWVPVSFENTVYDFYQYFTFKIIEGELIEILP